MEGLPSYHGGINAFLLYGEKSEKNNRGFSAANNQTIKLSARKFILLLNPDTMVNKDIFSLCRNFIKTHSNGEVLGVRMIKREGWFLPESK
jgi:O-antigen biosynthesis protein